MKVIIINIYEKEVLPVNCYRGLILLLLVVIHIAIIKRRHDQAASQANFPRALF